VERILLDLPESIQGERVTVRPWRAGDGPHLFEAVNDSRDDILPWLPWGRSSHETAEESETKVRQWRAAWDLRDDLSMGVWIGERLIGGIGLHRIDWSLPSFEMGYWQRTGEWGKGYATEAARLVLAFAFRDLGAVRVWLRCATGNDRSIALARRLGMRDEGLLRNATRDADGRLWDVLTFGMVPEEAPTEATL
jgi:ribosomal-protein-serine acetyltransferase